jgi:nicotinamide mononucleotide transporter
MMDIVKEWQLFASQWRATSAWQWAAVLLGVSEVLLARANKILLYPAGILASAISMYLLATAGLYGECLLNGYYVVMSVYGWWHWAKKKHKPPVKISYCTKRDWWIVAAIVVFGYGLLTFMLTRFTPSTVPELDAIVTATAWAGMWLLAQRKIENWILLNISNAISIPLLWHKDLPLFSALAVFLFIVAVQGYYSWRKKLREDDASSIHPAA